MKRPIIVWTAVVLGAASALAAQTPGPDTLRAVSEAHRALTRFGTAAGEAVWPGYRPDTLPMLSVFPGRGTLLAGWRGTLPTGVEMLPGVEGVGWRGEAERGAASTTAVVAGRPAAQVVVSDLSPASLFGLAAHEAFHVFQRSLRSDRIRFGRGENSFLVSTYPVFDVANEAGMALEGRLLRAALDARGAADARRVARQFLAVRETRHRRLGHELAQFEALAELNEGLAEYARVRALMFAAADSSIGWRGDAGARLDEHRAGLEGMTANTTRSLRLRFYWTGPAMALLLDRLSGPGWQGRVMTDDLTLQEALALACGYREGEAALAREAGRRFDLDGLRAAAAAAVAELREARARQIDSLLARPGIEVVIAAERLPGGDVGLCGIDPQNLLQADPGVLVHTRWLRACWGGPSDAVFNAPVVHDRRGGMLRAVIGQVEQIRVTIGGTATPLTALQRVAGAVDVGIEAPGLTLRAARADLDFDGRALRVRLNP